MAQIKPASVLAQVSKLTKENQEEMLLSLLTMARGEQLTKTNSLVNPTTLEQITAIVEELDGEQLHDARDEALSLFEDQESE